MFTDKKMLELIGILKGSGKIRFEKEFCNAIGLKQQNLSRVRKGERHFTPEQIRLACKEYGVDANWIVGEEENTFRKKKV